MVFAISTVRLGACGAERFFCTFNRAISTTTSSSIGPNFLVRDAATCTTTGCPTTGGGRDRRLSTSSVATSSTHGISSAAIERVNETKESLVEIRTTQDGKGYGLFAVQDISVGQQVFRGEALHIKSEPDSHTIQTGWKKHAIMDLPALLVNHSCQANVGVEENDVGAYDFNALTKISRDEEVLFDYETTEYEITSPFPCSCGAPSCRGVLKGFRSHQQIVLALYGRDHVAQFLLQPRLQHKM